MPDDLLFDTSSDELLISVYARQGRTLDDLPYTPQFEAIYAAVAGDAGDAPTSAASQAARQPEENHGGWSRNRLFHHLHNLRKSGRLPRMGRAAQAPPQIDREHEQLLTELVESQIERLSLRDQLPYTPAFDQIVNTFNARAGLSLSPHDVWRVIAKLAK